MNRAGDVLFRSPKVKLWKARALPLSIWIGSVLFALLAAYWLVAGEVSLEAFMFLLLVVVIPGHIGFIGSFVLINPLEITTTYVVPPSKPLTRLGIRRLAIPWRAVTSIEETRRLYTGPDGVTYAFSVRTEDGRGYSFKSLYVAWQTESTAEMRRAYEMMKAIAEAFERGTLERLDQDADLIAKLRGMQTASYPELDLFSRTLASKLAMAVGGSMFVVGLILTLLEVPANPWVRPTLWIVGFLIFGLGLSTKRALAGWGQKSPSTGS